MMILYNVTISLDSSIHEEWLHWMKTKHIPDVMNTGMFIENKVCRLMVKDEITYAIQYTCESNKKLEEYNQKYATKLQKEHTEKYRGKFGSFRTILEIVYQQ